MSHVEVTSEIYTTKKCATVDSCRRRLHDPSKRQKSECPVTRRHTPATSQLKPRNSQLLPISEFKNVGPFGHDPKRNQSARFVTQTEWRATE